ncbi:MAG: hypothetical protein JWP13_45, partial [Candidatus Saccharibacteria bacterium]|nr:hypothetical protein [Candidatus Saccharibacteria bacterium]
LPPSNKHRSYLYFLIYNSDILCYSIAMIVSSRLTPKLFFRMYYYGIVNRPVFNSFAVGFPLLIIVLLHGILAGVLTVAALALLTALVYIATSLFLYLFYRDKSKRMPVSYKVDASAIKITYGDHTSPHNHTVILRKDHTRRAWVFGRSIYVRHKSRTYCLFLPDTKRTAFIKAMKLAGWFKIPKLSLLKRAGGMATQLAGILLVGAALFFAFPGAPQATPSVSGQTPAMSLEPNDVLGAINGRRAVENLVLLRQDDNLTSSANLSCEDMTKNKYFGDTNPKNGHSGYEYIQEYYADRWIVEVSLPIGDHYTADQVIQRWIDNSGANVALLDQNYTIAGIAKCAYTADKKFDSILVVHLASN